MERKLMKENIKNKYEEDSSTIKIFEEIADTWLSNEAVESIYNDLMRLKEMF